MMRLPAMLCASGLLGLLIAPVAAQTPLPSRVPATESPVIAPDAPPPVAEWWKNGGPRVRTIDSRLTALFKNGLDRSRLLRDIVDQVDASNVVVYIGFDPTMKRKGLAGQLTFSGSAGNYRYLRALINPDLPSDLIIASIAHELQHVLEVVASPEVRTENGFKDLYKKIGSENRTTSGFGWETAAAQQVGYDVRRELVLGRGDTVAHREAERKGGVR